MILKLLGLLIVASLCPCLYYSFKTHDALKKAAQFEGTVIGHEKRRGSKGGVSYALTIKYRDHQSQTHTFTTNASTSPAARDIGEKLVVFHHKGNRNPDILIFEHLFLINWLWFCLAIAIMGCFVFPTFLKVIYLK